MKITAVHSLVLSTTAGQEPTYEQSAGLRFPEASGSSGPFPGRRDQRHTCAYPDVMSTVLVSVEAEGGLIGYGEAHAPVAPRVAHTIVVDLLAPLLIGEDARQIDVLWERMFSSMRLRSHTQGFMAEAIAGVDIALWDLLGKHRREPIWLMLGGGHHKRLPVYSSGVRGSSDEERVACVEQLLDDGFTVVKASCGRGSLKEQMSVIRPVAEAIGSRGRLLVDAHGAFDLADAERFADFLAELGNVDWFEDPLVPEDAHGYSSLTASTHGVRIAMGETECNRYGVRDRLQSHQCDVLLPDVCRAGGISETARIARLADSFGVSWASHVSMSTPIHLAAGLHVGAATPNFYISEYPTGFSASPIGDRLVKTPIVVVDGWIELSDKPGLGLELDLQMIEELTQLAESRS